MKATGLTIPADDSRIEVELDAAPNAAAGTSNVVVRATGPRGPADAPEPPVALSRFSLSVNPAQRHMGVDVMFVLDVTGSMQPAINGVRDGIIAFAQELEKRRLDARVGLVAFRDRLSPSFEPRMPTLKARPPARAGRRGRRQPMARRELPGIVEIPGEPFLINVAGEVFTRDYAEFGREVGRKLVADGGGDEPESSLDGLALAARQSFRKDATRVLILITDAPPQIPDKEIQSVDEASDILRDNKIDQLHLVINEPFRDVYTPLQGRSPGTIFNLEDAVRGRDTFASLLPTVSREIARITTASQPSLLDPAAATRPPTPVPPRTLSAHDLPPIAPPAVLLGVQSQERFAAESSLRLLLAIAVWTGMITALIAMALCAGQHRYLKGGILPAGDALRSGLGGLLAGCAGGARGPAPFSRRSGRTCDRTALSHSGVDAAGGPGRDCPFLLCAKPSRRSQPGRGLIRRRSRRSRFPCRGTGDPRAAGRGSFRPYPGRNAAGLGAGADAGPGRAHRTQGVAGDLLWRERNPHRESRSA